MRQLQRGWNRRPRQPAGRKHAVKPGGQHGPHMHAMLLAFWADPATRGNAITPCPAWALRAPQASCPRPCASWPAAPRAPGGRSRLTEGSTQGAVMRAVHNIPDFGESLHSAPCRHQPSAWADKMSKLNTAFPVGKRHTGLPLHVPTYPIAVISACMF